MKLLFFPPFPYFSVWKEVTVCSSHVRDGELCSTSLRAEHLHKLFGIFLHRMYVSSSPLTYLFSHLFISPTDFLLVVFHLATCLEFRRRNSNWILMDICFICWVITQYWFDYFIVWIVPTLAIRSSFSWFPWSLFFFNFIYLFLFIYGCVGSSFLCEGFL